MSVLGHLQPQDVFYYFEQITAIPHGSGNPTAIGDYCVRFAASHGLRSLRDGSGNVIVFKDGDADKAPVILQGHLDMVCVKAPDSAHDFLRDPLPIATDGDCVFSRGTTLGGDDGIAVAMILAILADETLHTPPIEAVFTMDEETGMYGVIGLDPSVLRGRRMINLDSETEGAFCVSCAGGARVEVTKPMHTAPIHAAATRVTLTGLAGGHSGMEIHKGHQNAIRVLAQLLASTQGVRLVSMDGGKVDNAIPHTCSAVFTGDVDALRAAFEAQLPQLQAAEPGIRLLTEPVGTAQIALTAQCTAELLEMTAALPNGVQKMSAHIENFVETSLNLGRCTVDADGAKLGYCVRSSADDALAALIETLKARASDFGATAQDSEAYPAWQYREDSPLRERVVAIYREQYGREPTVEAIHAGLECGIFAGKIPDLDCISMGPDLFDVHTPQERLSVASTARTYALLRAVLQSL